MCYPLHNPPSEKDYYLPAIIILYTQNIKVRRSEEEVYLLLKSNCDKYLFSKFLLGILSNKVLPIRRRNMRVLQKRGQVAHVSSQD